MDKDIVQSNLNTIQAIETLINQLEQQLEVKTKPSPFKEFLNNNASDKVQEPQQVYIDSQNQQYEESKQQQFQLQQEQQEKQQQQQQQKEQKEQKEQQEQQEKKEQQYQQQQQQQQQLQQQQQSQINPQQQISDEKQKQQEIKSQKALEGKTKQQQSKSKNIKNQAEETDVKIDLGEFVDLVNVDIRVGEIKECWKHPESDKLYCEKIDIGTEVREIASGLQNFIPIDQMSGLVLVLSNLKARKLAGFNSNGMVLCASNADHSQVEILRPLAGSKVGERIKIQGFESLFKDEIEPILNPKKKQWENSQPLLLTNDQLEATFKGHLFVTSVGTIKCQTLKQAHIS